MQIAILVVAMVVRLGVALSTECLFQPELWEYETIATNLVNGKGFTFDYKNTVYRSYCEPLFPWLCATIYLIVGHEHSAIVVLQIALSIMTIYAVMLCTRYFSHDRTVVAVAGALVAFHPALILYTCKLHPLTLDALCFTVVAWSCLRYREAPSSWRSAAIGAVCGVCFLTRPTVLVTLPLIAWWLWRCQRQSTQIVRDLSLIAIAALAIGSPWVVRNFAIHDHLMLTRSTSSFVLWLGNNPASSGSSKDDSGRDIFFEVAPEAFRARIMAAADEVTQNRMFHQAAVEYIRSDLSAFVHRTMLKFVSFWWFGPQTGINYPPRWMDFYRIYWGGLALSTLVGLYILRAKSDESAAAILVAGIAVAISLAQSVYYVEGRHRLAIEPLLAPLMAVALSRAAALTRQVVALRGGEKTC